MMCAERHAVTYSAARALGELKAQHNNLRDMMERCEAFADELQAGRCGPLQLTREVTRLRLAFAAHNKFEEEMLRPVLLAGIPGDAMDLKIEEHVASHRYMRSALARDETSMLREAIESMRAHLDAEELYLVSAATVRAATE